MSLRQLLLKNPSLIVDKNIFYQKNVVRNSVFAVKYIALRNKEERVYSDKIVQELPEIPDNHPLSKEWQVRKISMEKLLQHLKARENCKTILELGCGNGWLSNKLAANLQAEICGMDINDVELSQASDVFSKRTNLSFLFADVFSVEIEAPIFDTIIAASCVQYFPDLRKLINRLLELLVPSGEIHIVDSPVYRTTNEINAAQKRSRDHFISMGFPEMADWYFHHSMDEIGIFNYKILENPNTIASVIKRRIFKASHPAFPWILIKAI
jgi:cyclopropane fatty-acyl-phospholipid synthase-like methyltransferase